jgi:hypothetical protein
MGTTLGARTCGRGPHAPEMFWEVVTQREYSDATLSTLMRAVPKPYESSWKTVYQFSVQPNRNQTFKSTDLSVTIVGHPTQTLQQNPNGWVEVNVICSRVTNHD